MEKDIRSTPLFRKVQSTFDSWHQPGSGTCSDGDQLAVSPDGQVFGFSGTVFADLESAPHSQVFLFDVATRRLTSRYYDQNNDRNPKWSPVKPLIAFLSDRETAGKFQLFLAGTGSDGEARPASAIDGCIETFAWSPDGQKILMGVAGLGADLAGCQGGATIVEGKSEGPAWMPQLDTGDAGNLWRTAWILDVESGSAEQVSPAGLNIWECSWLGDEAILAIASTSHSEGSWYTSRLVQIDVAGSAVKTVYAPTEQVGLPTANPSGSCCAFVEAVCSDRMIVAGDLKLLYPECGSIIHVNTDGVDVTHLAWRNDDQLVFAGHRGFETVVGELRVEKNIIQTIWVDGERTMGAWYPAVLPLSSGGAAGFVECYDQAPRLMLLGLGKEQTLLSLGNPHEEHSESGQAEPFRWVARDGLEMQGWLVKPRNLEKPAPLVMDIHGGPVWACRNRWQARLRGAQTLCDHGIVSFYPNPRGSSCRGQKFASLVRGDMGGEDTYDYLSGIDALVAAGIADPQRLGVTGISYGGFMSAWLITQDSRFAAAVPISPVTNWYSQHRTSQIPFFDEYFLDGSASEPGGKFFERSPVMFADRVKCPTLTLTGAKDQNTPPTQALEFHRSLLENGVKSVLATYPTAGHGIRSFPEVIDHTTRYVGWFLEHLQVQQP